MLEARVAPLVVAIDGRSGVGKSILASQLGAVLPASVIPTDDFFAAELTSADWDARSPSERARVAIDWRRLRRLVLEPLLAGRAAVWHPFDFAAGVRADGSYAFASGSIRRDAAPLIILEGAYSSRPELADLVEVAILVEAPAATRHERLALREAGDFLDAWHRRWDAAEDYFFTEVRPRGGARAAPNEARGRRHARRRDMRRHARAGPRGHSRRPTAHEQCTELSGRARRWIRRR